MCGGGRGNVHEHFVAEDEEGWPVRRDGFLFAPAPKFAQDRKGRAWERVAAFGDAQAEGSKESYCLFHIEPVQSKERLRRIDATRRSARFAVAAGWLIVGIFSGWIAHALVATRGAVACSSASR